MAVTRGASRVLAAGEIVIVLPGNYLNVRLAGNFTFQFCTSADNVEVA
jgi:hypothetical protein